MTIKNYTSFNVSRILFGVLIAQICGSSVAKEVDCESVSKQNWYSYGTLNVCNMLSKRNRISIDEPNVTIGIHDKSITGLLFSDNKNVFFLPVQVAKKFPSLIGYEAEACSIKEIFKENFKGLSELKYLGLQKNQIEKILSGTLDDLTSLEKLSLCEKILILVLLFNVLIESSFKTVTISNLPTRNFSNHSKA